MAIKRLQPKRTRQGAVVILVAITLVMMVAMVAFAVDYGWLMKVRTDMQRSADAAALAAVQDLIPAADGTQDLDSARAAVRTYVTSNLGDASFNVADDDIEIGRYDTSTIYSDVTLLNSGLFDAVRVTLRRDGTTNPRATLFFARALGIVDADIAVTATAVLQKPTMLVPGADILPIAIHEDVWNNRPMGDTWSIYGDGHMEDLLGNNVPGNWGTVDIGATSNSTSDLDDQIRNGLRQEDLDSLYDDNRIPNDTHIDGQQSPLWVQADTGFSAGMKNAIKDIEGMTRLVPIYKGITGNGGNNVEFDIVGWGVVEVGASYWQGGNNSRVNITKTYKYDGDLAAKSNGLSNGITSGPNGAGVISGAYSSPVLVE